MPAAREVCVAAVGLRHRISLHVYCESTTLALHRPQVAGFINFVKQENMFYPACTLQRNGRICNKKAMEQGVGQW